jgi:hypothetical protein
MSDRDAAYRAAPRQRFDPSTWSPEKYAQAKKLVQEPFEDPETGDRFLAAVSQYEQDHSAHPDFLDFSPLSPSTDHAVGGEGAGSYVPTYTPSAPPTAETQVAGRAMGPLGAKAQQLASIPERAWKGFKEAGNDALVSGLQGATFDHGDDWVGSLQGADKGAAIRAETAAARARSPVATFGGDALVQGSGDGRRECAGPRTRRAIGGVLRRPARRTGAAHRAASPPCPRRPLARSGARSSARRPTACPARRSGSATSSRRAARAPASSPTR